MTTQNKIQLFEEKKACTVWDSEQEKWFFSVVDVIESPPSQILERIKDKIRE